MRSVFLLTGFLCLLSIFSTAQVPKKFNYQAVLRNSEGELIIDQSVDIEISIIDENSTGTVLYTETHTKTTNAYGLVNLVIGSETPDYGVFFNINWAVNDKFIKILVDATDIGTFQLLTVPFAMHAASATNLGSENVYTGTDTLFVVKDAEGNPVFVVFPDGAKVIVAEATKGSVGGFAVSGRSPTKEISNYFNVSGDNTPIVINPSESRVVWFPRKEAFWAGRVLIEHPDSVGLNSLAIGYEAVAKGSNSQSLGYQTRARGNFSTAIGYKTQANGVGCFAVGGQERGVDGTATGVNTIADGTASFALGLGANASGIANTAIGLRSSATGNFASTAFGVFANATANRATAIGFGSVASAEQSLAIGVSDTASAYNSMAMGVGSKATGIAAIALGTFVEANTTGSFVVGQLNDPYGSNDNWNTADPLFVVGNGIFGIPWVPSTAVRSNAFTILKNGNMGVGVDTPQRTVHIKDVMRLEPCIVAPSNPSEGDIYFDGIDKKLMVYDGTIWQACW
jgi:YadA head domain repeat (2 copies)